jgi:hypothetical protein
MVLEVQPGNTNQHHMGALKTLTISAMANAQFEVRKTQVFPNLLVKAFKAFQLKLFISNFDNIYSIQFQSIRNTRRTMLLEQSALAFLAAEAMHQSSTCLVPKVLQTIDPNVPEVLREARSINVQVSS